MRRMKKIDGSERTVRLVKRGTWTEVDLADLASSPARMEALVESVDIHEYSSDGLELRGRTEHGNAVKLLHDLLAYLSRAAGLID